MSPDRTRVLWVDDDVAHLAAFVHAVEGAGYCVGRASTVEEARHLLDSEGSWDAIVLDILLPPKARMTPDEVESMVFPFYGGLDLLEHIAASVAPPPVVVMTKVASPLVLEQAKLCGVAEVLGKGMVTPKQVVATLRRVAPPTAATKL